MTAFDMFPTSTPDLRVTRAWTLANALKGHGYEPDQYGQEVYLPGEPGLTITCDHRDDDAGRLWYTTRSGDHLAQADTAHLPNALIAIKERIRPTAPGRGL